MLSTMRQQLRECNSCLRDAFFGYETQKVVAVNSRMIGVIYRCIQVSILVYISLWVMYHERGYQAFDTAVSGVMIKVKGIVYTNRSQLVQMGEQLWDAADYKVPAQQNSGIFITTNVVITPNQTQGRCPESSSVEHVECFNNSQCPAREASPYGNGINTGICDLSVNRCEIFAWCPPEEDKTIQDDIPFKDIVNITLLIKNSIEFPRFRVKRRNILPWMTTKYLKNCHYNSNNQWDKYCPIFRLGELFRYTETDVDMLLRYGGSVAISIDWQCDLDYSEEYCLPKYTFSRLDDINHQTSGQGWNFHHAYEYQKSGKAYRTLIKAYGVQFFILVTGRGGRFDILNFTMNCGSGLALLGAATLCCDLIILHFLKNKKRYREAKFDLFLNNDSSDPGKLTHHRSMSSASINNCSTQNSAVIKRRDMSLCVVNKNRNIINKKDCHYQTVNRSPSDILLRGCSGDILINRTSSDIIVRRDSRDQTLTVSTKGGGPWRKASNSSQSKLCGSHFHDSCGSSGGGTELGQMTQTGAYSQPRELRPLRQKKQCGLVGSELFKMDGFMLETDSSSQEDDQIQLKETTVR